MEANVIVGFILTFLVAHISGWMLGYVTGLKKGSSI